MSTTTKNLSLAIKLGDSRIKFSTIKMWGISELPTAGTTKNPIQRDKPYRIWVSPTLKKIDYIYEDFKLAEDAQKKLDEIDNHFKIV